MLCDALQVGANIATVLQISKDMRNPVGYFCHTCKKKYKEFKINGTMIFAWQLPWVSRCSNIGKIGVVVLARMFQN
jgi:hypothetical protein